MSVAVCIHRGFRLWPRLSYSDVKMCVLLEICASSLRVIVCHVWITISIKRSYNKIADCQRSNHDIDCPKRKSLNLLDRNLSVTPRRHFLNGYCVKADKRFFELWGRKSLLSRLLVFIWPCKSESTEWSKKSIFKRWRCYRFSYLTLWRNVQLLPLNMPLRSF